MGHRGHRGHSLTYESRKTAFHRQSQYLQYFKFKSTACSEFSCTTSITLKFHMKNEIKSTSWVQWRQSWLFFYYYYYYRCCPWPRCTDKCCSSFEALNIKENNLLAPLQVESFQFILLCRMPHVCMRLDQKCGLFLYLKRKKKKYLSPV